MQVTLCECGVQVTLCECGMQVTLCECGMQVTLCECGMDCVQTYNIFYNCFLSVFCIRLIFLRKI